jgi:hypothetical protein
LCIVFAVVNALNGGANAQSISTVYDMTRMLNEPHPLASQMGTRWQPAVPTVLPVIPRTGISSGAANPAVSPTTIPLVKPVSESQRAGQPVIPQVSKSPAVTGQSKISGGVWQLEFGNEDRGLFADVFEPIFEPIFGESATDGGMTWGGRISYTPNEGNPDWFQRLRQYLVWVDQKAPVKVSYSVEQDALTPNRSARFDGRVVRPHAGYLAFNARVAVANPLDSRSQRVDQFDFIAGLVGPVSGAQLIHKKLHEIIASETDPWDEIKSEPVFNLNYEYGYRFFLRKPTEPANLEFHPYVGVALGNALTYGSLGLDLRLGGNLGRDMGAPRHRLLLSGENFSESGDYWVWNISLGVEGRVMAHSVFIDGNAFRDTAGVDGKDFVYDVQLGFEAGYGANRFSIMNVYRSREFKGQQFTTEFIRMSVSTDF